MPSTTPIDPTSASTDRAPAPEYYVSLTRRALLDLRNNALAIGIYALIIRVYRATREAVPLSAADIAAFDPTVRHGAATRALRRLIALGYLLPTRERGRKSRYTPAWGLIAGHARPLDLDAAGLGRPRHLPDLRLPQRLLDTCLGRFEPHHGLAAVVTRYTSLPLLSLADVGAYALAQAGLPAELSALARLGLARDGSAGLLPADAELLALVAAGQILSAGEVVALTEAGLARAGRLSAAAGQAGGLIAAQIGGLIASGDTGDRPDAAPRRQRGRAAPQPAGSHGIESSEGSDSPPTPQGVGGAGGGATTPEEPAPAGSLGRLLAIGVRRDVAAGLAERPLGQTERVIAEGRARPEVRSLAAWVVSALRALPAEAPAAAPPKVSDLAILTHPDLSNGERTRWLNRFRSADPTDRPGVLARFHAEHPVGRADCHPADILAPAGGRVQ